MKRKLFMLVTVASMALVSLTGCKKNAVSPSTGGSLKDKLVGTYKMTKLTVEQNGQVVQDVLQDNYSPCDQDNLYALKADMTSAVIDAGDKCSPSSDDTGTWSLPDDNTIVMDGQAYHIDNMNGGTLNMSVAIAQNGSSATLKMTYVKQ